MPNNHVDMLEELGRDRCRLSRNVFKVSTNDTNPTSAVLVVAGAFVNGRDVRQFRVRNMTYKQPFSPIGIFAHTEVSCL